ncbi:uncharacterized protein LOC133561241 [Nerophis ophidion]|uniref:uncharacterized protein LOC133561241 n=1 Tax=Nerophis ophidion TaxID=159077 RepID=UPI002ADFC807|nr:uncharacterized protein LOC133561241 [Nerophis ophidion]
METSRGANHILCVCAFRSLIAGWRRMVDARCHPRDARGPRQAGVAGSRGALAPISATIGRKAVYTLDKSPPHRRANVTVIWCRTPRCREGGRHLIRSRPWTHQCRCRRLWRPSNHYNPGNGPDGLPSDFYAAFCKQLTPVNKDTYKSGTLCLPPLPSFLIMSYTSFVTSLNTPVATPLRLSANCGGGVACGPAAKQGVARTSLEISDSSQEERWGWSWSQSASENGRKRLLLETNRETY